jgi:hypothetical protein
MGKRLMLLLVLAGLSTASLLISGNKLAAVPADKSPANSTIEMGQWPPPECGPQDPCPA